MTKSFSSCSPNNFNMKHMVLMQICILLTLVGNSEAFAGSRFSILTGFGQSASRNTNTFSEGPMMLQFKLETNLTARYVMGFEHSRAVDTSSSSSEISVTTLAFKFHFLNSVSGFNDVIYSEDFFHVIKQGLSPYLGFGLGFGSSSSSEEDRATDNSTSIVVQAKVGLHWNFSRYFGLDSEVSYAFPIVGDGEIFFLTAGFGLFYNF